MQKLRTYTLKMIASVLWLAPTVTSTNTLLAQVAVYVPGQDVVRYVAGGGGNGCEDTGRPAVTVRASRRLRTLRRRETTLPPVGKVAGYVQLYG